MRDSLSYRLSDEGEQEFDKAVRSAKKWIMNNANGAEVKLRWSIALKLSMPEGGSVQEALSTAPLFPANGDGAPKQPGWICKACKNRHHENCTKGDCTCDKPVHTSPSGAAEEV